MYITPFSLCINIPTLQVLSTVYVNFISRQANRKPHFVNSHCFYQITFDVKYTVFTHLHECISTLKKQLGHIDSLGHFESFGHIESFFSTELLSALPQWITLVYHIYWSTLHCVDHKSFLSGIHSSKCLTDPYQLL